MFRGLLLHLGATVRSHLYEGRFLLAGQQVPDSLPHSVLRDR